ncbi:MAG: MFS transporter [Robiginitomaculum sp.]|nr:MAG: MFS transporter [Robiginitomaculum sp.]
MTDTTKRSPKAARRPWRELILSYPAMLVLGFASGLPLMMVFSKLSFWLREVGVDRSTIGFFYWVGLAYTFKFLWAPVVDRLQIPVLHKLLGRRRSWMFVALIGTAIGLLVIGFSDPTQGLMMTLAGAFILAYSGATLDISVDAWRIESAPNREQAGMAATYILGYRFAIMFAGVGLVIADNTSWKVSYGIMALVMLAIGGLLFKIREPQRAIEETKQSLKSWSAQFASNVSEPFLAIVQRLGVWTLPVFGLVAIYRLSDFTMGVMASPLYADLGYTKTEVGTITGLIAPWLIVLGGFAGGGLTLWAGLMRALLVGAVVTVLTNGAFAWLAMQGTAETWRLLIVVGSDNFAAGFVGAAFIAYLSALTDPANAATQYAVFSSLYAFFCKFLAGFSGVLADAIGYVNFFLVTASYGLPAAILVIWIMLRGSPEARGVQSGSMPDA